MYFLRWPFWYYSIILTLLLTFIMPKQHNNGSMFINTALVKN